MMIDQYNRKIDYLRVSVTDRCNLRCVYCMPADGVEQVNHNEILTFDEILRICRSCAELGIRKIKLTGGEPLVRKGLCTLLGSLKALEGIEQVTLTTNGILLAEQMDKLAAAGLDAVNISLDTLDEKQYEQLTRRDGLTAALAGLRAALAYPDIRVKVNCVLLHGQNEEQWIPIAKLAKELPVDVRFIEMMPIGFGKSYPGGSQTEVYERLKHAFGEGVLTSGNFGNGPAVYMQFPGFSGKIGFISAVSHQFCESCNRVRLSSEGFLKPCLQYALGADLKSLLRTSVESREDEQLKHLIRQVIYEKPRCHQFTGAGKAEHTEEGGSLEEKQMSSIGG